MIIALRQLAQRLRTLLHRRGGAATGTAATGTAATGTATRRSVDDDVLPTNPHTLYPLGGSGPSAF